MSSPSQPISAGVQQSLGCCGVKWGLLGRIASARGIEITASDGLPNNKTENHIATVAATLAYSMRMPSDAALTWRGRSMEAAGRINFYSPGVSLTLRGGGPFTLSFCIFSASFLADLATTEAEMRLDDLGVLPSIESTRLAYLGRAMFHEAIEPGFASSLFAEATGIEIALEIARYNGARLGNNTFHSGGLTPRQMRQLELYVRDHLADDLTLRVLAKLLDVSVRHLSRALRQTKGVSVHRWVADCRLAEARRLLTETDLSMHEIAQRSAFHSPAAFSTAFRAASGFSPGEFRRLALA